MIEKNSEMQVFRGQNGMNFVGECKKQSMEFFM